MRICPVSSRGCWRTYKGNYCLHYSVDEYASFFPGKRYDEIMVIQSCMQPNSVLTVKIQLHSSEKCSPWGCEDRGLRVYLSCSFLLCFHVRNCTIMSRGGRVGLSPHGYRCSNDVNTNGMVTANTSAPSDVLVERQLTAILWNISTILPEVTASLLSMAREWL